MSIEYFPEDKCWNCAYVGPSEEHHLWKGWQRKVSPTIRLCSRCHRKAHSNQEFYYHLQVLYNIKNYGKETNSLLCEC